MISFLCIVTFCPVWQMCGIKTSGRHTVKSLFTPYHLSFNKRSILLNSTSNLLSICSSVYIFVTLISRNQITSFLFSLLLSTFPFSLVFLRSKVMGLHLSFYQLSFSARMKCASFLNRKQHSGFQCGQRKGAL